MHLTFAKIVSECPVCESSSVRRSRRTGFVERIWFRLAFVWPYRCDDCDSRFWGFQRCYQASHSSLVYLLELCAFPAVPYSHPARNKKCHATSTSACTIAEAKIDPVCLQVQP